MCYVCVICVIYVGVAGLTEAVCSAADEVLSVYSLKEGVTVQGLEQLITDIQHTASASLTGRYVHSVRSVRSV